MHVLVIGAHGGVGRRLIPILRDEDHQVRAMIRDEAQAPEMAELGGAPVLGDLEGTFAHHMQDVEAVVFTAGSGADTGADKTALVDGVGAIRAVDGAKAHGVRRFVMVSARGADDPDRSDSIRHYLVAKCIADAYLERSPLDYTVLRPGRLTDDDGTGSVRAGSDVGSGSISRSDVARVIARSLQEPATVRKTFELVEGDTPIEEAVRFV